MKTKEGHFKLVNGLSYNIVGFTTGDPNSDDAGFFLVIDLFKEGAEIGAAKVGMAMSQIDRHKPLNEGWKDAISKDLFKTLEDSLVRFEEQVVGDVERKEEEAKKIIQLLDQLTGIGVRGSDFTKLQKEHDARTTIGVTVDSSATVEEMTLGVERLRKMSGIMEFETVLVLFNVENPELAEEFKKLFPKTANVRDMIKNVPEDKICNLCVLAAGLAANAERFNFTPLLFVVGDPNSDFSQKAYKSGIHMDMSPTIVPIFKEGAADAMKEEQKFDDLIDPALEEEALYAASEEQGLENGAAIEDLSPKG